MSTDDTTRASVGSSDEHLPAGLPAPGVEAPEAPSSPSGFDVDAFRAGFPALDGGMAYFDGPGGTQTPLVVGEAIARTLTGPLSNRGSGAESQRNADAAVTAFRVAMADLLGADSRDIVHGRSATELTFALARTLGAGWGPGDEVVVTSLDHDSNIRPWVIAAERAGATVRWWELDPETGELPVDRLDDVLSDRTRLVAMTGASNLVGTMPDVRAAADRAHAVGAHVHVDAVHLVPHVLVDLAELGADTLVCSPYKFFGPHCGVLAGAPGVLEGLHPDKLVPSTDVAPERFELGTLPYEMLAGTAAAVDVLAGLGRGAGRRDRLADAYATLHEHEWALAERVRSGIEGVHGVTVWSRAARRTPTLYLTTERRTGEQVAAALLERGILAPAGTFYAHEAGLRLGVADNPGVRVGIAPYTTVEEVDRLVAALHEAVR